MPKGPKARTSRPLQEKKFKLMHYQAPGGLASLEHAAA